MMHILTSQVALATSQSSSRTEVLLSRNGASVSAQAVQSQQAFAASTVQISDSAQQLAQAEAGAAALSSSALDPHLQTMIALLREMFGQEVNLLQPMQAVAAQHASSSQSLQASQGVRQRVETVAIRETTSLQFEASGQVQTADHQTIQFRFSFALQTETELVRTVRTRAEAGMRDPLVLNFSGNSVSLNGQKLNLDLFNDGQQKAIPMLNNGGYLARRSHASDEISKGAQLFGPATGDGFAELAMLDADHNQWIDAADPAFAELGILSANPQGKAQFTPLQEAGVGALYLGRLATEKLIETPDQKPAGKLGASGVWLGEHGQLGSLQHIDLLV
ncbi:hypothetical protein [Undibacterium rugosum]|uniref:Uncharacterized protein n=1 Tax=Undibacterium rugosum TaxID=2762291 RepID=A0A923I332_9BURK|nr:hypothetical protein [Undibacterium rugosum]MBC3936884.1 hypothetical protein [Undibacterium rugosum]MBR7780086.1 hypothetical protein [Undibacterium rugosum]